LTSVGLDEAAVAPRHAAALGSAKRSGAAVGSAMHSKGVIRSAVLHVAAVDPMRRGKAFAARSLLREAGPDLDKRRAAPRHRGQDRAARLLPDQRSAAKACPGIACHKNRDVAWWGERSPLYPTTMSIFL